MLYVFLVVGENDVEVAESLAPWMQKHKTTYLPEKGDFSSDSIK